MAVKSRLKLTFLVSVRDKLDPVFGTFAISGPPPFLVCAIFGLPDLWLATRHGSYLPFMVPDRGLFRVRYACFRRQEYLGRSWLVWPSIGPGIADSRSGKVCFILWNPPRLPVVT
jgi:hypothetical protein